MRKYNRQPSNMRGVKHSRMAKNGLIPNRIDQRAQAADAEALQKARQPENRSCDEATTRVREPDGDCHRNDVERDRQRPDVEKYRAA